MVKKPKSDELTMEFEFENPEIISANGIDKVRVTVLNKNYFASKGDTVINFQPMEISLPRQIASKEEAAVVEKVEATVSTAINVVGAGNMVVTIFSTAVIYYLWGMINGMQVISLTCLF